MAWRILVRVGVAALVWGSASCGGPGPLPWGVATPGDEPADLVIDAIESEGVAVEDASGARFVVPRAWVPPEAREGDVLRVTIGRDGAAMVLHLERDEAATEERRRSMRERRDALPRAPEGDLDL